MPLWFVLPTSLYIHYEWLTNTAETMKAVVPCQLSFVAEDYKSVLCVPAKILVSLFRALPWWNQQLNHSVQKVVHQNGLEQISTLPRLALQSPISMPTAAAKKQKFIQSVLRLLGKPANPYDTAFTEMQDNKPVSKVAHLQESCSVIQIFSDFTKIIKLSVLWKFALLV